MIGTAKFLNKIKNEINNSKSNECIANNDDWNDLLKLPLERLKDLNMALQVESKIVNDTFWICSNDKMIEQIKIDDPESVVYHIDEIVRINNLKPDIKSLRSIHDAKKCFKNSKVVRSKIDI